MTGAATAEDGAGRQRLPPVLGVGVLSLALAISGVSYLTSSLPGEPELGPAIGLLAGAAVAVLANIASLARARGFAWGVFFTVGRWILLAYAVIAGMLMFIFVYNELPARQLAFLVATLAVGAIDVPMMLAFSVARYHSGGDSGVP